MKYRIITSLLRGRRLFTNKYSEANYNKYMTNEVRNNIYLL